MAMGRARAASSVRTPLLIREYLAGNVKFPLDDKGARWVHEFNLVIRVSQDEATVVVAFPHPAIGQEVRVPA